MQRWCTKLRSLAALHLSQKATQLSPSLSSSSHRLLSTSHQFIHKPLASAVISSSFKPLTGGCTTLQLSLLNKAALASPVHALSFIQVRHLTKKEKKEKLKKFKPRTPVVSKIKKVKIKFYSSFKGRFRVLSDGTIRRWKEGKRHNAHSKSKKAKRRLRQPGTVPPAYAKVMKKLNFCG
ncbi:hypothetical protein NMG60_11027657 [Bertholletia excelsa]